MYISFEIFVASVTPSRAESISNSSHISSYDSSLSNSSGKPSLTLIRTPQQTNWHNQTQQQPYVMAQKPSNGKPLSNLSQQQSSNQQLSLLINRVKQDPSMDEQQRSDINDQTKQQQQPMFPSLINKTPVNRLPSTTFIQQQPQQQWYSATPQQQQQQFNPPPNYTAATRARYTPVMQQTQSQPSPQTLLAPLRSNASTPPPNYLARAGSTPNLTRAPSIRPSPFPSQQQQQQPQDPSAR